MNPKSRVILIYIANTPCISRKSSSYSGCVQNPIVADVGVFMIPLLWWVCSMSHCYSECVEDPIVVVDMFNISLLQWVCS